MSGFVKLQPGQVLLHMRVVMVTRWERDVGGESEAQLC